MPGGFHLALTERGIVSLEGPDARALLQGLVTNDVERVAADRAIYAALLTPQGKYLADFFIAAVDGKLLLDAPSDAIADLIRRLAMYRLRAKVEITDASAAFAVHAAYGDDALSLLGLKAERGAAAPLAGGIAFADPRTEAIGARAILPPDVGAAPLAAAGLAPGAASDYERLRIRLGLPAHGSELVPQGSFPLECGFEALDGVDFQKGCYIGQEVTARMKHRALVRKRLYPLFIERGRPSPGEDVAIAGAKAGTLTSVADGVAMALIRTEAFDRAVAEGLAVSAGAASLRPLAGSESR